jgi:hypothetical protein
MRRFFFCLIIAGFALSGCSWQTPQEPETNFFRDFSLGQMVERMKVPELKPSDGDSGASTSSGETTRRRREFDLTFMIEEQKGTKFDEVSFINKLKDEIGRVMSAADVRVEGGGNSGDDSFYFDYSKKDHEGWLEVMGARVEGNKYKLRGVIREIARKQKE